MILYKQGDSSSLGSSAELPHEQIYSHYVHYY